MHYPIKIGFLNNKSYFRRLEIKIGYISGSRMGNQAKVWKRQQGCWSDALSCAAWTRAREAHVRERWWRMWARETTVVRYFLETGRIGVDDVVCGGGCQKVVGISRGGGGSAVVTEKLMPEWVIELDGRQIRVGTQFVKKNSHWKTADQSGKHDE